MQSIETGPSRRAPLQFLAAAGSLLATATSTAQAQGLTDIDIFNFASWQLRRNLMDHVLPAKSASRLTAMLVGALILPCTISPAMSQAATGGDYKAELDQAGADAGRSEVGEQVFYIATVHLDAKTNVNGDASHPPEPFPESAVGSSGGLIVRRPDEQGNWSVRAFVFQPSQVVVRQGDKIVLNFVGVQGPSHTIAIEGQNERISLKRGEMKTVRLVAEQPGTIRFVSVGREPTMQGSILVLRRE